MDAGLGKVWMMDPVLAVMVGQMLRRQSSRVTGRSGHQCPVDVPGRGRVRLGLGKRKRSLDCIPIGFLLALAGYEVADPQQTGPHAVMVVVLAGTVRSLLPGQDPLRGPVTLLHLLVCLQEMDHTLQNLCLLHLRVLQFLNGEIRVQITH